MEGAISRPRLLASAPATPWLRRPRLARAGPLGEPRYFSAIAAHGKLTKIVRHRVGVAAHRAGAATRTDIRRLDAELKSLREELHAEQKSLRDELNAELKALREELSGLGRRVGALVDHPAFPASALGLRSSQTSAGSRVPSRPLSRRPRVSVVVPCYNYARFLAAAVGSVTSQTGVDVDVLIIDDCSTDGTRRLAESLAEKDQRIRVVVHGRNVGHIATFNEGIASAEGDYLVLLSADDLLTPGSLARATALLEAHPSVGFVYGSAVLFEREPVPPARDADDGWTIWNGRDWIEERCGIGSNAACSPEVVMRTSLQHQIGEYRPQLPHTADMEMWLRAAVVGDVGRIEGADQAFYRQHPDSLTRALCVRLTDGLRARRDAFAAALGTTSAVQGAERLYGQVRWTLAAEAITYASEHFGFLAPDEVEELEAFALELFPSAKDTAPWLQLDLRRSAAAFETSGSGS